MFFSKSRLLEFEQQSNNLIINDNEAYNNEIESDDDLISNINL